MDGTYPIKTGLVPLLDCAKLIRSCENNGNRLANELAGIYHTSTCMSSKLIHFIAYPTLENYHELVVLMNQLKVETAGKNDVELVKELTDKVWDTLMNHLRF